MATLDQRRRQALKQSILQMMSQGKDPKAVRAAHYYAGNFGLDEIDDELMNFARIKNDLPLGKTTSATGTTGTTGGTQISGRFSDFLNNPSQQQTSPTAGLPAAQKDLADQIITLKQFSAPLLSKDEIEGVGGFGGGTVSRLLAKNLGYGTEEGETNRNLIGMVKGTIAKLRGGTSFTPNEEALLESYTPTINDSDMVVKTKLKNLNNFFDIYYKNVTGQDAPNGQIVPQQGQPQQPTKPQYSVEGAIAWAEDNPNNPKAKQILEANKKGTLQSIIARNNQPVQATPTTQDTPYGLSEQGLQKWANENPEAFDKWADRQGYTSDPAKKEELKKGGLIDDLSQRVFNIIDVIKQGSEKKGASIFDTVLNVQRTQLRGVGEVAGAVGDVATRALEFVYDQAVPDETKEAIKQKASEFMATPQGQSALGVLQQGTEAWGKFKETNPEVAKDLEASFNILTAIPAGKGLGMAGKEAKAIGSDVLSLAGKNVDNTINKQTFKVIKPTLTVGRDKKKVFGNLASANQELIQQGAKPKNFKEYVEALSNAKQNVWSGIENKLQSAGKDMTVDLDSISQKLIDMASSNTLKTVDKSASNRIMKMAESLISEGKRVSVQDAEKIKQYVNSELSGAFGKFNLSNAEQNAKKLITKEIGTQLDDLLSSIPGEFSDMKKKYGALREIEEDALKRLIVFERQNPQGLVESFSKISGVGNVLKGLSTGSASDILKGGGELLMGQIQKKANDADAIIKKIFSQSRGFKSKTLNYLQDNPPGLTTKNIYSKKGEGEIPKQLSKDPLIEEAKKYKSAEEFVKAEKLKKLSGFDEEIVRDVQATRHLLHTTDADDLFFTESSDFEIFGEELPRIADEIEKLRITGKEKRVADDLRALSDKKYDLPYDEDYEYNADSLMEIDKYKESVNKVIEDYLEDLDEYFGKYSLDDISDARADKAFKPSGFARARSLLGEGSDNTASSNFFRSDEWESQLTDIWNKANKK